MSGGGGVGKFLAEWIVSGSPTLDLSGMQVSRFDRHSWDEQEIARRAAAVYSTYYDITEPTAD